MDKRDENNAENGPIGERINSSNALEQLLISKVGHLENLNEFGQYILGFYIGDFTREIEKGFLKEKAEEMENCLLDKLTMIKNPKFVKNEFVEQIKKNIE